ARCIGDARGVDRELVQRLLAAAQPGARSQDASPELALALVHPEQAARLRRVRRRSPQVGRYAVEAIPGMDQLVRNDVAAAELRRPLPGVAGRNGNLAGTPVFGAAGGAVIRHPREDLVALERRRPENRR